MNFVLGAAVFFVGVLVGAGIVQTTIRNVKAKDQDDV